MEILSGSSMSSNRPDTNDALNTHKFIEILLVTLKSKQNEIKKLKESVRELEQKSIPGINDGDVKPEQCVPIFLPTHNIPEHKTCVDARKQSNPDIFLFPARISESANNSGRTEHKTAESSGNIEIETEAVWNLIDNSKQPAVVPEQDFNSVINELIKTKTSLYNLQKYQKVFSDEYGKVEELKTEIHNLKSNNEKLKRDLKKLQTAKLHSPEEMGLLRGGKIELNDDAADLSQILGNSTEHSSLSSSVTLKAELDELRLINKTLKQENEQKISEQLELVKKNQTMQKEFAGLRESLKVLSTCLQEEKCRSSTAIGSLGSLRQQYEELRMEKEALEKERTLERRPSKKFSQYPGSWLISAEKQRSGSLNSSTELPGTSPRVSSSTGSYNIKPDSRFSRPGTQNNLSPQPFEKKPSNLSQIGTAIEKCPRCLVEFVDDDEAYRKHLHKCMNCD